MNRPTLHFAFEYHDRGWPIIPVNGKTPAVPWAAYQKERPSLDEVRLWFASNENYNLAVVTGRISDLVVIDCDTAEDAMWWRKNHTETPLVVTTGRGGSHFYYRFPNCKVGNKTAILGRRIDVRGEGGLVVAPPPTAGSRGTTTRLTKFRCSIPRGWSRPNPHRCRTQTQARLFPISETVFLTLLTSQLNRETAATTRRFEPLASYETPALRSTKRSMHSELGTKQTPSRRGPKRNLPTRFKMPTRRGDNR